jgi:hypothetical protein
MSTRNLFIYSSALLIAVVLLTLDGEPASAAALDKTTYTFNDPMKFSSDFEWSLLVIYDLALSTNQSQYDCGTIVANTLYPILPDEGWCAITPAGGTLAIPAGSYSLIELDQNAAGYEDCRERSYTACKASGGFYEEVLFTVVLPPPTPGTVPTGSGPLAYRPEASVLSPKRREIFSHTVPIEYRVTDQNDSGGPGEQKWLGLPARPVSLYYSETSNTGRRRLITEGLTATGTYAWDTSALQSGESYHIIVEATDNIGETGLGVSEQFTIDNAPPTFAIEADPPLSRGENVEITVRSSKPLVESPIVAVEQQGLPAVPVEMRIASPSRDLFRGVFAPDPTAGGVARISVRGADAAGNSGSLATSGGTFAVNVLPPETPIILSPLSGETITEGEVTLTGRARADTLIVLRVNDAREYTTEPAPDGTFTFEHVALEREAPRGQNILTVVSRDRAGNESSASVGLQFNRPPEVSFITPKKNNTVGGDVPITLAGRDENGDPLTFTLEVSNDGGKTWSALEKAPGATEVLWRTTEGADGEYALRASASDGSARAEKTLRPVFVRNLLPAAVFRDGARSITNETQPVVNATAILPPGSGLNTVLRALEWSLDGGKTFSRASARDGAFDSQEESVALELGELTEGIYTILVRVFDSRGYVGRARHELIVDSGPPLSPRISSPTAGSLVRDSDDMDPTRAGADIHIVGTAEPHATVRASIQNTSYEARADARGEYKLTVPLRAPGGNTIELTTIDPAGNESRERSTLTLRYNNPPILKFLSPREGGGAGEAVQISFEITDREGDRIAESSLSYRRGAEKAFHEIARNMSERTALWGTRALPEGEYELLLRAHDGYSESTLARRVFVDHTEPEVSATPLASTEVTDPEFSLVLGGATQDNLSGLEYVEYRIEDVTTKAPRDKATSTPWYKALITEGYTERDAAFRFRHPYALADGAYEVSVRATDSAGNISSESPRQRLRVDASAPRVGSFLIAAAGVPLLPRVDGDIVVPRGTELSLSLSLERDTADAEALLGSRAYPLRASRGRFETEAMLAEVGTFPIAITATDSFGNRTAGREIGKISVVPRGLVHDSAGTGVPGATISVFRLLSEEGKRVLWDAAAYGLTNPLRTADDGSYALLLPQSGEYELEVEAPGFRRARLALPITDRAVFVTQNFMLEKRQGVFKLIGSLLRKSK